MWYKALTTHGLLHSGPAGFLLVFFFAYFFYLVLSRPFTWIVNLCCPGMLFQNFEVDEEIDLYQNCLDDDDKEWTLMEEDNSAKYGI